MSCIRPTIGILIPPLLRPRLSFSLPPSVCSLPFPSLPFPPHPPTPIPVQIEDLKKFRQLDSATPGHPENFMTEGIEVTTGPLGQGIANAVGLAAAEKHLAARFNKPDAKLFDHYTYVIMGDGCNMEGISSEAASLAGHWGLGKLIAFYDDNHISIDGNTEISFTEDVGARYEAQGWQVIHVQDGNTDVNAIRKAIADAKACTDKPTLIKVCIFFS